MSGQAPKQLHLFDSFSGLPAAEHAVDAESPHVRDGVWSAGTCVGLTAEELAAKVAAHLPDERVHILPGWFKDTVPQLPDGSRYGLVHIDSDLYASAMDALDGLFSRGFIAEGAKTAEFTRLVSEFVGNPRTVVTNSCTMALTVAYRLCGVERGTEVISTPLTCVASTNSFSFSVVSL